MKIISIVAASCLFLSTMHADDITVKKEGISYIKMLGKALKTELKAHMKADPSGVAAMGFCTQQAEEITKKVNQELPKDVRVYRTSLKTRNEHNAPDATDTQVMRAYQKKADEKKLDPKDIQMMKVDGITRVYKPLLIKPVCMKCHGDSKNISTDIKAVLTKVYPKDMATGFKEGDFRGVIVSEMKK